MDYSQAVYLESILIAETKRPTLHMDSLQFGERTRLLTYMRDATVKFNLEMCVLHSGAWLLDNFVDKFSVEDEKLLHLAISCLYIAAKFMLDPGRIPSFFKLCNIGEEQIIDNESFDKLENMILHGLNCDVMMPNTATFIQIYYKYAITLEDIEFYNLSTDTSLTRMGQEICDKLEGYLWIILKDLQLCSLAPSLLALAALMAARRTRGLMIWPSEYNQLSSHAEGDIHAVSLNISHCDYNLHYFDS